MKQPFSNNIEDWNFTLFEKEVKIKYKPWAYIQDFTVLHKQVEKAWQIQWTEKIAFKVLISLANLCKKKTLNRHKIMKKILITILEKAVDLKWSVDSEY